MASKLIWTDDMLKKLMEMRVAGCTYTEIGKALGGFTRNAVAGKVFHLGLTVGRKKQHPVDPPPSQPKSKRRKKPEPVPQPHSEPAPVILSGCQATVQLQSGQCRWPLWQDPSDNHAYCCKPVADGKVYCEKHCALAYSRLYIKGKAA